MAVIYLWWPIIYFSWPFISSSLLLTQYDIPYLNHSYATSLCWLCFERTRDKLHDLETKLIVCNLILLRFVSLEDDNVWERKQNIEYSFLLYAQCKLRRFFLFLYLKESAHRVDFFFFSLQNEYCVDFLTGNFSYTNYAVSSTQNNIVVLTVLRCSDNLRYHLLRHQYFSTINTRCGTKHNITFNTSNNTENLHLIYSIQLKTQQ